MWRANQGLRCNCHFAQIGVRLHAVTGSFSCSMRSRAFSQISRLVGHSSTTVTEVVYRHQLNPVVEDGATAMDRILPSTAA
jgi:integrase